MIRRIQALRYRCLRYVDVRLDRFHVLVGPNAGGKSTLFDALAFLSDVVRDGLDAAVERRTHNFQDLVWDRPDDVGGFELAVEFDLPQAVEARLPPARDFRAFRYELAVSEDDDCAFIESERGMLMPEPKLDRRRRSLSFPDPPAVADTILMGKRRGVRTILSKSRQRRDTFNTEVSERSGAGWITSTSFGSRRSTLGNLPESPEDFPAATYVKELLKNRVQCLFLDAVKMRRASPPNQRRVHFASDGSNLPWMVRHLKENHAGDYDEWLRHVQTTLPDLKAVETEGRGNGRTRGRSTCVPDAPLPDGRTSAVVDGFRWDPPVPCAYPSGVSAGRRSGVSVGGTGERRASTGS